MTVVSGPESATLEPAPLGFGVMYWQKSAGCRLIDKYNRYEVGGGGVVGWQKDKVVAYHA